MSDISSENTVLGPDQPTVAEGAESITATTPSASDTCTTTESSSKPQDSDKIDVFLKATGDAPIIKKKRWTIVNTRTIGWVSAFLKKFFKMADTETLFLYVNQSYAPAPDEVLKNLYDCFGSENKLVLHYSRTQAWG